MIHEVDEALRTLVRRDALNGSEVEVVFDAPTKEWATRRNTPTLDIYLYDIREDPKRRQTGIREQRSDEGIVTSRRALPRWFKLSYLVTAWTQRPEDEHRLLSSVLACFVRFDLIPADVLTGSLADANLAVGVFVALPPPEDRQISDVWSALGGELKPALDLVVVAPVDTARSLPYGPPVREGMRFGIGPSEEYEDDLGRRETVGGAAAGGGGGAGPGRRVGRRAADAARERQGAEGGAAAGDDAAAGAAGGGAGGAGGRAGGRRAAGSGGPGSRQRTGTASRMSGSRRGVGGQGGPDDEEPEPVPAPEEEVISGTEEQKGRIFRIRGTTDRP